MKIQLKNWIFIYFLGKFVAKNRNFGNNIIFLQQFFPLRGELNPLTPLRTPLLRIDMLTMLTLYRAKQIRSIRSGFFDYKLVESFWLLFCSGFCQGGFHLLKGNDANFVYSMAFSAIEAPCIITIGPAATQLLFHPPSQLNPENYRILRTRHANIGITWDGCRRTVVYCRRFNSNWSQSCEKH